MEQTNFVGVDCYKDTIACYINGKFKEFKLILIVLIKLLNGQAKIVLGLWKVLILMA